MAEVPYSRVITELPLLRNFSRLDRIWIPVKRFGEHITRRISLRELYEGAQKMIKSKYTIRIVIRGYGSYKLFIGDGTPDWNSIATAISDETKIFEFPEGTIISVNAIPSSNPEFISNPFWTLRGGFALTNPVLEFMVTSDNTLTMMALPMKIRSFNDPVYNKPYQAVSIGTQEWTTEIIQATGVVGLSGNLYSGAQSRAIATAFLQSNANSTSKWRIPSLNDFNRLFNFVGGSISAGRVLKADQGWKQTQNESNAGLNGLNVFGFNGTPTGWAQADQIKKNPNSVSSFWTTSQATGADSTSMVVIEMNGDTNEVIRAGYNNDEYAAIRIVRDLPET